MDILDSLIISKDDTLPINEHKFTKQTIKNVCIEGLYTVLKRLITEFNIEPTEEMLDLSIKSGNVDMINFLTKYVTISDKYILIQPCKRRHEEEKTLEVVKIVSNMEGVINNINFPYIAVHHQNYQTALYLLKHKNFRYTNTEGEKKLLIKTIDMAKEVEQTEILNELQKYLEM